DLKWAPDSTAAPAFLPALGLPKLPRLPNGEGTPVPPQIRKTTSGRSAIFISNLASLSSPACGGGAERSEAEGGPAFAPSGASRHLPRRRGRKESGFVSASPRPLLRVKAKGGAPRGNRNAQKSGCHTRAVREFRRALALYVRTLKAQVELARVAIPRRPP